MTTRSALIGLFVTLVMLAVFSLLGMMDIVERVVPILTLFIGFLFARLK